MPPKDSDADVHAAIELLKRKGVVFEPGLSNSEISFIEEAFGFTFPPDLRAFLQAELPVDVESASGRNPFPNWRGADRADLQARLDWPFEGIAFDVENNAFWLLLAPIFTVQPVARWKSCFVGLPERHHYLWTEPLGLLSPGVRSSGNNEAIWSGCTNRRA